MRNSHNPNMKRYVTKVVCLQLMDHLDLQCLVTSGTYHFLRLGCSGGEDWSSPVVEDVFLLLIDGAFNPCSGQAACYDFIEYRDVTVLCI